jgi:hypothetical protein
MIKLRLYLGLGKCAQRILSLNETVGYPLFGKNKLPQPTVFCPSRLDVSTRWLNLIQLIICTTVKISQRFL